MLKETNIPAKAFSVYNAKGRLHINDLTKEVRKINEFFRQLHQEYPETVELRRFVVRRNTELSLPEAGMFFCEEETVPPSDSEYRDQFDIIEDEDDIELFSSRQRIKHIIYFSSSTKGMFEFLKGITLGLNNINI